MKRMLAVLMAAMVLTGVLTGCSGTATFDDGYARGNVSTTRNGTVNGRNDNYNGYRGQDHSNNRTGSYGQAQSGTMTGGTDSYGQTENGAMTGGTGMVGGR